MSEEKFCGHSEYSLLRLTRFLRQHCTQPKSDNLCEWQLQLIADFWKAWIDDTNYTFELKKKEG